MTAILLDALFSYWRLSGDARVPEMVVRWCDFLNRRGLVPDGSRAYYVIDCFGSEAASEALRLDLNRPPRCFNWALQSSSQMVYFLRN